jgi:tRNA-specific 2-thiouridylase
MSGGVDSSVAALLVNARERVGITLKLFDGDGGCCSIDDVTDAKAVCQRLGIPHYSLNYKEAFNKYVVEHFVRSYESGITPNPCIECNRTMKFERLFTEADAMKFNTLATGHYAAVSQIGGNFYLQKGLDETKDQSYVLYMIRREFLPRVQFPLGTLRKSEVREIAAANGFINARKKDSQDVCFVPDGDYSAFMAQYTGKTYPPGDFVDVNGEVLGRHSGSVKFTIGQRRGLGVSHSEPLYVKSKNGNSVTLAPERELYSSVLFADNLNILVPDKLNSKFNCSAKTRYRQPEQPCTAELVGKDKLRVEFTAPQRAITPGQAVVLYDGNTILGGGTIL